MMSFANDCDEGFVTNIVSKQSFIDKKKSTNNIKKGENVNKNVCEQCFEYKTQNEYLFDENSNLKELNKELYEIDQKRQKYDIERQDYILRLLKTIKKLQLRSSRMISSDSESDCTTSDRRKSYQLNDSFGEEMTKEVNEKEKTLLEKSYENAIKENVNLHKEMDEMRANFDNLIEQLSKIESEHIQVLEFQAKVHKEDYECEKREKVNALNELTKINSEKEKLNQICINYEKKIQKLIQVLQKSDLLDKNDLKESSSLRNSEINHQISFKTNSLPNDFRRKMNKSIESLNKCFSNSEVFKSNEMIECPNCEILFPIQLHEQLVQHFEKCQRND